MAVGIAAGVSAAFGAPIGGSLFAYEISKPNTFWSFSLTWKVFFASTISTFTLSVFKQIYDGLFPISVSSNDIIKLGSSDLESPALDSVFAAVVLGFVGGLMGATFIIVNNQVNIMRKKYLKEKWMKVTESIVLVFLTVTAMYFAVYIKYAAYFHGKEDTDIC